MGDAKLISQVQLVLPLLLVVGLSLLLMQMMSPSLDKAGGSGRYKCVDGLRGYLALFVFVHHAYIWYEYKLSGSWVAPESMLYAHLGRTSVAFFFMITSFLFFGRLLEARSGRKDIDWLRFFVGRILRLWPIYLCCVLCLFLIVFALTDWQVVVGLPKLLADMAAWVLFTFLSTPDVNGLKSTSMIVASVTWSLKYEWFYYLLLPIMARMMGLRVSWLWLSLSAVFLLVFISWLPGWYFVAAFVAGAVAAYIVKNYHFRPPYLMGHFGSMIVLILLAVAVGFYPAENSVVCILCLFGVFTLVAGGVDFFGLLSSNLSVRLGEYAYGIYLFHGLLLYVVFGMLHPWMSIDNLSWFEHWGWCMVVAVLLMPTVVWLGKSIEQPAMLKVNAATHWVRMAKIKMVRALSQTKVG